MSADKHNTAIKIQQTMSAYCRYVDTKQWDELHDVLTKEINVVFKNTDGETVVSFKSPAELIASCKEAIEKAITIHHLHNPEFTTINGGEAEAIWAMEDRWYMENSNNNPFNFFHGYGHYHVKFLYQPQSEKWLINAFELRRLKMDYKNI